MYINSETGVRACAVMVKDGLFFRTNFYDGVNFIELCELRDEQYLCSTISSVNPQSNTATYQFKC